MHTLNNIKKQIGKRIPSVIEKLGYLFNPLLLKFISENNTVTIFYFHGIYASDKERDLNHVDPQNNVTINEFKDFLNYFLEHNYIFIKPEDLLTDLPNGKTYGIISFDDGYFNNLLAVDLLNKYKIPAVVFVTTKNIQEHSSYWWDIIYKYRKRENKQILDIKKEQVHLKFFKYSYINEYIKKNFGVKSMCPWSDIDRPLIIDELKTLSSNPLISIGNHTHNHAILINYSEEEIREEFNQSNKIILGITGRVPLCHAFPNGLFNDLVLQVAKEAGFRMVFTTVQKKNILPLNSTNFLCLNRLMIGNPNIKNYGSFYRLGYSPLTLYSDIKNKIFFK
ncbi:MAG TPA: polysaccharide deacetylase family protein [Hanamia sp.]